jgi:hypothetical protein
MAVEARAPCGDWNNNNKNVLLIKIITDFIFMALFSEIFLSSHEISSVCKQEVRVSVNWVKTLWHPDNNSDRSLKAESAQMRQSQSHVATDGQSVSQSWCRAPSGAHDQKLSTVWQSGAPSDEGSGLSFVIVLVLVRLQSIGNWWNIYNYYFKPIYI